MNSLATELRIQVVEEAAKSGDLKALRCVNRSFCSLVEPRLFTAIKFDSGGDLERGFRMLESLAVDKSRVPRHVHTLIIRCEDGMSHHLHSPRYRYRRHEEDPETRQAKIEKIKKAQEDFDNYLPAAIRSLANLKSVQISANRYSLSPASLWTAMDNVKLQELVIQGEIEQPCLEYLGSYSGLIKLRLLHIESVNASTNQESNKLATYLAETVLPKHKETLETLGISGKFNGMWSFGDHNAQQYAQCVHLREFRVSLNHQELSEALSQCLHFIHTRLPKVASVVLCSTESKAHYQGWCGTGRISHLQRTRKLMADAICSFPVPEGFNGNIRVRVGNQDFILKEVRGGIRKYHCIGGMSISGQLLF